VVTASKILPDKARANLIAFDHVAERCLQQLKPRLVKQPAMGVRPASMIFSCGKTGWISPTMLEIAQNLVKHMDAIATHLTQIRGKPERALQQ
jgi:hypothetical protein